MQALVALALLAVTSPTHAQTSFQLGPAPGAMRAPQALLATWGDDAQCAAHAAGRSGGPSLAAYVLGERWLSRGPMHCLVTWLQRRDGPAGVTAHARLQCGEDAPRDYHVRFQLDGSRLDIRWSRDATTRGLRRCARPPTRPAAPRGGGAAGQTPHPDTR